MYENIWNCLFCTNGSSSILILRVLFFFERGKASKNCSVETTNLIALSFYFFAEFRNKKKNEFRKAMSEKGITMPEKRNEQRISFILIQRKLRKLHKLHTLRHMSSSAITISGVPQRYRITFFPNYNFFFLRSSYGDMYIDLSRIK